jgi:hypothetical protein
MKNIFSFPFFKRAKDKSLENPKRAKKKPGPIGRGGFFPNKKALESIPRKSPWKRKAS